MNNSGSPPIVNRLVIVDNGHRFLTAVVSPQAVMVTAMGRKMTYLTVCPVNTPLVLAYRDFFGAGDHVDNR